MSKVDDMLHIGDIVGVHGLNGTIVVYAHTRPSEAIGDYSDWWIGKSSEQARCYSVQRCWQHGKRVLANLEGVDNRQQAELLKQSSIWIPDDAVEVDDDEYLWQQLVGCDVVLKDSKACLGRVSALEAYGAQDNLLVQTLEGAEAPGEWLIPFIESVIIDVDLDEGVIVVDLPDGMDACFTPKF